MKEKHEWQFYVSGDWLKGTQGRLFKRHKCATKYAKKIGSSVIAFIHHPILDDCPAMKVEDMVVPTDIDITYNKRNRL